MHGDRWMPTADTRLHEYLRWWLEEHVARRFEPRTLQTYAVVVERWIIPPLGQLRLGELTLMHCQDWIDACIEAAEHAPSTIRMHKTVLSSAITHAVNLGVLPHNTVRAAITPRLPKTRFRALERDEITRLMVACEDEWYGPLFVTAVLTGMRQSELTGLRWRNVHRDRGVIDVVESCPLRGAKPIWRPTKGQNERQVPIPALLDEVLGDHAEKVATQARRAGTRGWSDYDLTFPTSKGTHLQPGQVYELLVRISAKADIVPRVRMHELRHTYATVLVEEGVPLAHVGKLLGHEHFNLTARTYVHLTPASTRSAGDALNKALTP